MRDDCLDRIEGKVDKLADAVVEMARMEERLVTLSKRIDNAEALVKKRDDRLDEMERQSLVRGQKIALADHLFWLVVTGAVGFAFVFLR